MAKARLILLAVLAVVAAALFLTWSAEQRADKAERDAGLAAARTLTDIFEKTSALQVARLSGDVVARSRTEGCLGLCTVTQTTRAPYEVHYTVDLTKLKPSAYRWDGDSRTMIVTVPVVSVGRPNVDFSRVQINQDGVWVSRRSNADLQTAAAKSMRLAADASAGKPENINKAQNSARDAIQALVSAPLKAAGLGSVNVVVRLPGEAQPPGLDSKRWDESRPLAEVLQEAR